MGSTPNLPPDERATRAPYFRHLGRMIDDPDLVDALNTIVVDAIEDPSLSYRPQPNPAIIYTYGRRLKQNYKHESLLGGVTSMPEVVDRLASKGIIDGDLATKGLDVAIKRLRLSYISTRNPNMHSFGLKAVISDKRCSAYKGYVVDGESNAITRAIEHRKPQHKPNTIPQHDILIGTLSWPKREMPFNYMDLGTLYGNLLSDLTLLGPLGGIPERGDEPALT